MLLYVFTQPDANTRGGGNNANLAYDLGSHTLKLSQLPLVLAMLTCYVNMGCPCFSFLNYRILIKDSVWLVFSGFNC